MVKPHSLPSGLFGQRFYHQKFPPKEDKRGKRGKIWSSINKSQRKRPFFFFKEMDQSSLKQKSDSDKTLLETPQNFPSSSHPFAEEGASSPEMLIRKSPGKPQNQLQTHPAEFQPQLCTQGLHNKPKTLLPKNN